MNVPNQKIGEFWNTYEWWWHSYSLRSISNASLDVPPPNDDVEDDYPCNNARFTP